ncbi:MAG: ATP-binding cassette domain-containing protein, partial [Candidatus Sumerlaeota bacterium]|nr:ATP-binding cassette domain-containing protein [Candidatus Sumerlaeota bacterium]
AYAHEFIERLEGGKGYQTVIGQAGQTLSGGQRQRLAIARALYRNPQILIFDEATSSLDVESERYVQRAIENLLRGRTAVIIAHRLSTIRHADEILVMRDGRIVERGRHEDLLRAGGEYWRLYHLAAEQQTEADSVAESVSSMS